MARFLLILAISLAPALGSAQTTLAPTVNYPGLCVPFGVAAADLNNDNILDLANVGALQTSFMINNGNGTFQPVVSLPAEGVDLAAADLDLDGDIDLAVADVLGNAIGVLQNTGGAVFSGPVFFPAGTSCFDVVAADLDGDGLPDLATINTLQPIFGTITVLFNLGGLGFALGSTVQVGMSPTQLDAGDLDGDGDLDLAVADATGNVSVVLNTAPGVFAAAVLYSFGTPFTGIDMHDLDNDGHLDLVVPGARVLWNDGAGNFPTSNIYPGLGGVGGSSRVECADLDCDGRSEIIVTDELNGVVLVGTNGGSRTFVGVQSFPVGVNPIGLAVADLDGGLLDVATANNVTCDISVLLNGGCAPELLRGDCDGNGVVSCLTDAIFLLGYCFIAGPVPPCLAQCDISGDRTLGCLNDALYCLIFEFLGGAPPPPPFPSCGPDANGVFTVGCATPTCP